MAVATCSFACLHVRAQHYADPVALNTSLCHIPAPSQFLALPSHAIVCAARPLRSPDPAGMTLWLVSQCRVRFSTASIAGWSSEK